jgi:DUF1365 family protein
MSVPLPGGYFIDHVQCAAHAVFLQPKTHEFSYGVFMAWLDLDELPLLASVGVRRNRNTP